MTSPADQPDVDSAKVQPAPVQTSVGVAIVTNEAGIDMVLLDVRTPSGANFYFFDPDAAVRIGNRLRTDGKAAMKKRGAA